MRVTGAGIAVIAVVCIGFLVFLIVLGVARIRSTQRRTVEVNMEERQEMEWDNSALNITVNPLDHEVGAHHLLMFSHHIRMILRRFKERSKTDLEPA